MKRNKILEVVVTSMMTLLGIGLTIFLLVFVIVGLLGGTLKEMFYYIRSSEGFSTKATSSEGSINVLATQE